MRVFLSWSGERSGALARYLEQWLPIVIHAVEPWVSTAIEKGTRGIEEISLALETTGVGILCLTRENLDSPWIHYEAGALAKSHERVWTFLIDIGYADVSPPLSQFQHTLATREDVFALLKSINQHVESTGGRAVSNDVLSTIFERFWPDLDGKIREIRDMPGGISVYRSTREVMEEVLEHVRYFSRHSATLYRHVSDRPESYLSGSSQAVFKLPSLAQVFNDIRAELGVTCADEQLGTIYLHGERMDAERVAERLVTQQLVLAVRVDAAVPDRPILSFATPENVPVVEVVEYVRQAGHTIQLSYPAVDT